MAGYERIFEIARGYEDRIRQVVDYARETPHHRREEVLAERLEGIAGHVVRRILEADEHYRARRARAAEDARRDGRGPRITDDLILMHAEEAAVRAAALKVVERLADRIRIQEGDARPRPPSAEPGSWLQT